MVTALAGAYPATRSAGLRGAGAALFYQDDIQRLDLLVILTGGREPILPEAADLLTAYPDAVVVLFDVAPGPWRDEFARRGVAMPTEAVLTHDLLVRLGVAPDRIRVLKLEEGGTLFEVRALASHLAVEPAAAPAVLVSWHHSNRVRRVLERTFDGHRTPAVRVPRQDVDRPTDWWQRRESLRLGLVELQKLALDWLAHPFS